MPDTDAQVSAGPSGSNNGPGENPRPARNNNVGPNVEPSRALEKLEVEAAGNAAKRAMLPAVTKRLQLLPTAVLQTGDGILVHFSEELTLTYQQYKIEWPFTVAQLLFLARPIIELRRKAEKQYRNRLRQDCDNLHQSAWTTWIAPPGSLNERYERWLDATEPTTSLFRESGLANVPWAPRLLLPNGKVRLMGNIYNTDTFRSTDCAALVMWDVSLPLICGMGPHFIIPPEFFIDHFCSKLPQQHTRPRRPGDARYEGYDHWCHTAGVLLEAANGTSTAVFGLARQPPGQLADPQYELRLSCLRIRESFFVVAFRLPTTLWPDDAAPDTVRLPFRETQVDLLDRQIHEYFADTWVLRRLSELLGSSYLVDMEDVLLWLLAVWLYEREIPIVLHDLQELDYKTAWRPTRDDLQSIMLGRASVAQLRQNLASTKNAISSYGLSHAYQKAANRRKTKGTTRDDKNLTPRQLAAISVEDEYAWLDKEAAKLLPMLNETLQVMIASIGLEQSEAAVKISQNALVIAKSSQHDTELSRQSGQRASMLALLAAIYLPLTLATGIFGMNIRNISGENQGPDWRPVAYTAAGFLFVSLIFVVVFWYRAKEKDDGNLHKDPEAQRGQKGPGQEEGVGQTFGDRKTRSESKKGAGGKKWSLADLAFWKTKNKNKLT